MDITVSRIYFLKDLPCSGLQCTDLRSPDAEVKSLSISLQVPVHVTIFSWKHCCFCGHSLWIQDLCHLQRGGGKRGRSKDKMITQKGVAGTCKTQQSQAERQQRGRRKRRKLSFALKTNNPPNLNVFYFFLMKILLFIVITLSVITLFPYFITRNPNYNCPSFIWKLPNCFYFCLTLNNSTSLHLQELNSWPLVHLLAMCVCVCVEGRCG